MSLRFGRGSFTVFVGLLLFSSIGLISLLVFPIGGNRSSDRTRPIRVMAAAGLREPMELLAAAYQRNSGISVDMQFGGSNTLLGQIAVDRVNPPDLFIPADDSYLQEVDRRKLLSDSYALASQYPVIIVSIDAKTSISSIDDLWRNDMRISFANPDQAAIGKHVKQWLIGQPDGDERWKRLEEQITRMGVFKPTVNDVANDVRLGTVDVGVVWNATIHTPSYREAFRVVELQAWRNSSVQIRVGILTTSQQPERAKGFVEFLATEEAIAILKDFGLK